MKNYLFYTILILTISCQKGKPTINDKVELTIINEQINCLDDSMILKKKSYSYSDVVWCDLLSRQLF